LLHLVNLTGQEQAVDLGSFRPGSAGAEKTIRLGPYAVRALALAQ
jgi:hypothetical protein